MKKIIMDGKECREEQLTAAIREAEGRATARTIDFADVELVLWKVDRKLEPFTNAAKKGIEIHYTGAEKFPNAYRYQPESTHFKAVFNGRYWVVTDIYRDACPNRYDRIELTLTAAAKEAIISHYTYMM